MGEAWGQRGECPECGSSDGNVEHGDGHSYCFVCETRFNDSAVDKAKVVPMSEKSSGVQSNGS